MLGNILLILDMYVGHMYFSSYFVFNTTRVKLTDPSSLRRAFIIYVCMYLFMCVRMGMFMGACMGEYECNRML